MQEFGCRFRCGCRRLLWNRVCSGSFGRFLLWPAGISQHLQDAHLEAILTHEVQHVRRRDNLAAAMHMVVEAIFWFHPLVWWLGARLVEERERACDEEVLRLGVQPEIYAEGILKTCEFCVASPLACVSGVTGADLKQRMVRIMTQRPEDKLGFGKKSPPGRDRHGSGGQTDRRGPDEGSDGQCTICACKLSPAAKGRRPWCVSQNSAAKSQGDPDLPRGRRRFCPKLVYAPDPQFQQARRAKYQGVCVISVIIDAQGKPQHVQVVRHLGMGLDKKAVEAVKQYRFEPAMLHDKPVAVTVNIEVNFRRY